MNKDSSQETPKKEKEVGLFKGVMAAYAVLVLHALLIVVLGLIVLFFRGIIQYMIWIFLGGCALILASAWYSLQKLKKNHRQIIDVLALPQFADRNIEIKLLGGLASVKMSKQQDPAAISASHSPNFLLEDPSSQRLRTLADLGKLYEAGLITRSEYESAKEEIMTLRAKADRERKNTIEISPVTALPHAAPVSETCEEED